MTAPTDTSHDVLRRVADRTLLYDFTVWFWGDAIAMDGLLEAAELLGDPVPRAHCLRFYQRWARRPLDWRDHLEDAYAAADEQAGSLRSAASTITAALIASPP